MEPEKESTSTRVAQQDGSTTLPDGTDQVVNASGHVQELSRNFSAWSLIGLGLSMGNVWPALGGSILVALYNGGPPGIFQEIERRAQWSNVLQVYYTNLL